MRYGYFLKRNISLNHRDIGISFLLPQCSSRSSNTTAVLWYIVGAKVLFLKKSDICCVLYKDGGCQLQVMLNFHIGMGSARSNRLRYDCFASFLEYAEDDIPSFTFSSYDTVAFQNQDKSSASLDSNCWILRPNFSQVIESLYLRYWIGWFCSHFIFSMSWWIVLGWFILLVIFKLNISQWVFLAISTWHNAGTVPSGHSSLFKSCW